MDIGIGLPSTIPGVSGRELTDWARRAEAAGFSSLGTIDRVAYPNYEPLVALAAAAAVTERINLITAIMIVPYRRSAGMVAKQAATLHDLSGGRLVLGVAVGGREDDYKITGEPFGGRGKRFEAMLAELKDLWSIGPEVSADPPQILLGGQIDAAFRRAAEFGDGYIMGGGPPELFGQVKQKTEEAFRAAGRSDAPRVASLTYFALGDDPDRDIEASIGDYYSFLGEYRDMVVQGVAKGPDAVRERVQAFRDQGADELVLFPASSDAAQVDLLAEAVLS